MHCFSNAAETCLCFWVSLSRTRPRVCLTSAMQDGEGVDVSRSGCWIRDLPTAPAFLISVLVGVVPGATENVRTIEEGGAVELTEADGEISASGLEHAWESVVWVP